MLLATAPVNHNAHYLVSSWRLQFIQTKVNVGTNILSSSFIIDAVFNNVQPITALRTHRLTQYLLYSAYN